MARWSRKERSIAKAWYDSHPTCAAGGFVEGVQAALNAARLKDPSVQIHDAQAIRNKFYNDFARGRRAQDAPSSASASATTAAKKRPQPASPLALSESSSDSEFDAGDSLLHEVMGDFSGSEDEGPIVRAAPLPLPKASAAPLAKKTKLGDSYATTPSIFSMTPQKAPTSSSSSSPFSPSTLSSSSSSSSSPASLPRFRPLGDDDAPSYALPRDVRQDEPSWRFLHPSASLPPAVRTWACHVEERIPYLFGLQLRQRARTIAMGLQIPAGYSLTLDNSHPHCLGLVLTPEDPSQLLHSWALSLNSAAQSNPDSTFSSYPTAFQAGFLRRTFIRLPPNINNDDVPSLAMLGAIATVTFPLRHPI